MVLETFATGRKKNEKVHVLIIDMNVQYCIEQALVAIGCPKQNHLAQSVYMMGSCELLKDVDQLDIRIYGH